MIKKWWQRRQAQKRADEQFVSFSLALGCYFLCNNSRKELLDMAADADNIDATLGIEEAVLLIRRLETAVHSEAVAQAAVDYVRGKVNSGFADECGGIGALGSTLIKEAQDWGDFDAPRIKINPTFLSEWCDHD